MVFFARFLAVASFSSYSNGDNCETQPRLRPTWLDDAGVGVGGAVTVAFGGAAGASALAAGGIKYESSAFGVKGEQLELRDVSREVLREEASSVGAITGVVAAVVVVVVVGGGSDTVDDALGAADDGRSGMTGLCCSNVDGASMSMPASSDPKISIGEEFENNDSQFKDTSCGVAAGVAVDGDG